MMVTYFARFVFTLCIEWDHNSSFWDVRCHFASHACLLVASCCLPDPLNVPLCSYVDMAPSAVGHCPFCISAEVRFVSTSVLNLTDYTLNYKAVGQIIMMQNKQANKNTGYIPSLATWSLQSEGQLKGQGVPQSFQGSCCQRQNPVSRSRGRGWDESQQGHQKLELHWEEPRAKARLQSPGQHLTPKLRGWGKSPLHLTKWIMKGLVKNKITSLLEIAKSQLFI